MPALHAEAAADLARDDAELRLRDMQEAAGYVGARGMRALGPDIKREPPEPVVPFSDAPARLHRCRGDAVEDKLEPRDVMGPGKARLDRAHLAEREKEALVVTTFCPELCCVG